MQLREYIEQFIYVILYIIEGVLGLRLVLKLFGANPDSSFARWVYGTSEPILKPFFDIFPASPLEGAFVIELSTLFAILVYAFLGYGALALLGAIPVHRTETRTKSIKGVKR